MTTLTEGPHPGGFPTSEVLRDFAEIMEGLQPARGLFDLAKAILRDA